jgi:ArsR family transcriptional regulator, lead/cadmium/zinc/bismuth-responsive transcriptional repressor
MKDKLAIFRALGEQTKHDILKIIAKGEICACEIPKLIKKTQSNTSMHLAKLQDWGITQSRREGKKILHSLKDKRILSILRSAGLIK